MNRVGGTRQRNSSAVTANHHHRDNDKTTTTTSATAVSSQEEEGTVPNEEKTSVMREASNRSLRSSSSNSSASLSSPLSKNSERSSSSRRRQLAERVGNLLRSPSSRKQQQQSKKESKGALSTTTTQQNTSPITAKPSLKVEEKVAVVVLQETDDAVNSNKAIDPPTADDDDDDDSGNSNSTISGNNNSSTTTSLKHQDEKARRTQQAISNQLLLLDASSNHSISATNSRKIVKQQRDDDSEESNNNQDTSASSSSNHNSKKLVPGKKNKSCPSSPNNKQVQNQEERSKNGSSSNKKTVVQTRSYLAQPTTSNREPKKITDGTKLTVKSPQPKPANKNSSQAKLVVEESSDHEFQRTPKSSPQLKLVVKKKSSQSKLLMVDESNDQVAEKPVLKSPQSKLIKRSSQPKLFNKESDQHKSPKSPQSKLTVKKSSQSKLMVVESSDRNAKPIPKSPKTKLVKRSSQPKLVDESSNPQPKLIVKRSSQSKLVDESSGQTAKLVPKSPQPKLVKRSSQPKLVDGSEQKAKLDPKSPSKTKLVKRSSQPKLVDDSERSGRAVTRLVKKGSQPKLVDQSGKLVAKKTSQNTLVEGSDKSGEVESESSRTKQLVDEESRNIEMGSPQSRTTTLNAVSGSSQKKLTVKVETRQGLQQEVIDVDIHTQAAKPIKSDAPHSTQPRSLKDVTLSSQQVPSAENYTHQTSESKIVEDEKHSSQKKPEKDGLFPDSSAKNRSPSKLVPDQESTEQQNPPAKQSNAKKSKPETAYKLTKPDSSEQSKNAPGRLDSSERSKSSRPGMRSNSRSPRRQQPRMTLDEGLAKLWSKYDDGQTEVILEVEEQTITTAPVAIKKADTEEGTSCPQKPASKTTRAVQEVAMDEMAADEAKICPDTAQVTENLSEVQQGRATLKTNIEPQMKPDSLIATVSKKGETATEASTTDTESRSGLNSESTEKDRSNVSTWDKTQGQQTVSERKVQSCHLLENSLATHEKAVKSVGSEESAPKPRPEPEMNTENTSPHKSEPQTAKLSGQISESVNCKGQKVQIPENYRESNATPISTPERPTIIEKAISDEKTDRKIRTIDSTDEDSTLASTCYSSPVSYVEFSKVNDDRSSKGAMAKRAQASNSRPDDSKLAILPKLLAVDLMNDNEADVQRALDQLGDICKKGTDIAEVQKHGGHMSLVLVLRKWCDSAAVQAAGLSALHNAAESMEFSNAIVQLGALDLVLVAMKNHINNENVQIAGCGSLLNLTVPAPNAKQLVFELQGIQTICASCAAFPSNITLQKYALWNIQYMSYWDDFKGPIVKAGGLQALAEMVETFSATKEEAILKSARATMKRLL